ncbi:insulin-like growth factor-binding protein complex acid labile subunit [Agrilus planipennis]|uniref:Insulin-like growth factor-binding protein complex acid labile subunit n=1 Tax=Agrilus planipennis TaxID=224129 RepID=A0A7F5RCW4_AGRPL|nr:insulin-like growth factor-binding protein complex acid labile subunit [Agrilus planipennis]
MPNLRTIETEFNKISMWSPSWFTNSPNIVTVSFAHNKIASLPGNAFANLKGTHELDGYSVGTAINLSMSDSLVIRGMGQIGYLDLHKNSIKMLPTNAFSSLPRVGTLILDENN